MNKSFFVIFLICLVFVSLKTIRCASLEEENLHVKETSLEDKPVPVTTQRHETTFKMPDVDVLYSVISAPHICGVGLYRDKKGRCRQNIRS